MMANLNRLMDSLIMWPPSGSSGIVTPLCLMVPIGNTYRAANRCMGQNSKSTAHGLKLI